MFDCRPPISFKFEWCFAATRFWLLFVLLFVTIVNSGNAQLQLKSQSTVDLETLTFADGPATRFAPTVNGRTHQQTPLVTYRGYQYVTYFDAKRRLCIGRRKLPSESWEVIHFADHKFKTNDAHNTAVLGICDKDGTIHMAFDHHASQLNYRISKLGVAHKPESFPWKAGVFSGVFHTLGTVKPDPKVTYPRFFPASNGNLMLYYRSITSGNGDGVIQEYDGNKHDWSHGLGAFISREEGTYEANGSTSPLRCPYMNALSYAGDRLHASWIWRDRFEKTSPKNQHDLCYVYSDDNGRTWKNSEGQAIGRTGQKLINVHSPGLVVVPIPINAGLTNQNTHYAFPDGSIHVVMRGKAMDPASDKIQDNYFHLWRTESGKWEFAELPIRGNRPKLVGTKDKAMVLVYSNNNKLLIAGGRPNRSMTQWKWADLPMPQQQPCYGDALVDLQRWEEEQVLSVYVQEPPARLIKTNQKGPSDGMPTPLKVVDYQFPQR